MTPPSPVFPGSPKTPPLTHWKWVGKSIFFYIYISNWSTYAVAYNIFILQWNVTSNTVQLHGYSLHESEYLIHTQIYIFLVDYTVFMFIVFIDSPVARRRFRRVKKLPVVFKTWMGKACADTGLIDNKAEPECRSIQTQEPTDTSEGRWAES